MIQTLPKADSAAILLAGAHVWRRVSLETLLPRPLMPIANAPVINYVLSWLAGGQVEQALLCTNHAPQVFRSVLADGGAFGLDLQYFEDRVPRGPAGCARDAAALATADRYIVVDGAVIPPFPLDELLAAHRQIGAAATIVVARPNDDPDQAPSPLGIYVFEADALGVVPSTGYQDIKEVLIPRLYQANRTVASYYSDDHAPRILDLDSYFAANSWVLNRLERSPAAWSGYRFDSGVWTHETATVAAGARLVGPVVIGPGCRIDDGVIVVGPTIIGANCELGRHCTVGRSILWDHCRIHPEVAVDSMLLLSGSELESNETEERRTTRRRSDRPAAPRLAHDLTRRPVIGPAL